MESFPRLVLAGTASGVGKTTATVGLLSALRARGLRVAAFKCGPDYLDPTYHARVTGRSHNLDGWMMGREAVLATFARAAVGADIAVIEGVMGLYDGAVPTGDEGSSAEIAKWLSAPVVLVVDARAMARSLAAVAQGFARFDPAVRVAGVIANRIGGRGHLDLLREACPEPPVLGGLPARPELAFPERHLGLHTADATTDARLPAWGAVCEEWLDVDRLLALARSVPPLPVAPPRPTAARRCRIGLALDQAFHFYYEDNLARLEALGAELVPFSPVGDAALPAVDGLYFGGGYPELAAPALAANESMRRAIYDFGGPIYAECGGLMYLARAIRTLDGREHPMVGRVPGVAIMHERLCALGYVEVETTAPTLLGRAGQRFRGHEFRYSELALADEMAQAYQVTRRFRGTRFTEGYARGRLLASYVHAHWASNPGLPEAFVAACRP